MALDKNELKYLVKELAKVFATKNDIVIDEEILSQLNYKCSYMGDEEPEDDNVIWFDTTGDELNSEPEYENPLIDELFACIQTLQDQVQKLQAEVEYLKLNGGGGGSSRPEDPDNPSDETSDIILALEDGGLFLLEDGGFLILEESVVKPSISSLTLEDGGSLLLEDGSFMLLENN